jgi:endogenous inhibitor of DNA gyrase (YacG/DUF329 family)
MKTYESVYSTDQLIELSQDSRILKSESDRRAAMGLMRAHLQFHHHYNREELIKFISDRNFGKSIEDIVSELKAAVAAANKPKHAPPTSKPVEPAKPPVAVVVSCPVCGGRAIATEAEAASGEPIFCSKKCQETGTNRWQLIQQQCEKWITGMDGKYIECAHNDNKMIEYIRQNCNSTVTQQNLNKAYQVLTARGELLQPLTPQQIRAMSDKEFDTRARLEGSYETGTMGGVDLSTFQTNRPQPTVHSSNKTRTFNLPLLGYTGGGR